MEQNGEAGPSKRIKPRPPQLNRSQQKKLIALLKELYRDMPRGHSRSGPVIEYKKKFWENATRELNSLQPDRAPRAIAQWHRAVAYYKNRVGQKLKDRIEMTDFEREFNTVSNRSTAKIQQDQDRLERSDLEEGFQQSAKNSPSYSDSFPDIFGAEADVYIDQSPEIINQGRPFQDTHQNQNTPEVTHGQVTQTAGTSSQQTTFPITDPNREKYNAEDILKTDKCQDIPVTKSVNSSQSSKTFPLRNKSFDKHRDRSDQHNENRQEAEVTAPSEPTPSSSYQNNNTVTPQAHRKRTKEVVYAHLAEMATKLRNVFEENQRRSCEQADALAMLANDFTIIADKCSTMAEMAFKQTETNNIIAQVLQSINESLDQLLEENSSKRYRSTER